MGWSKGIATTNQNNNNTTHESCGSIGRLVTSETRNLQFESSHGIFLLSTVSKRWKKIKEAGNGPMRKYKLTIIYALWIVSLSIERTGLLVWIPLCRMKSFSLSNQKRLSGTFRLMGIFLNGPTPASLLVYILYKHKFYRKQKCRTQLDSNSDRRTTRPPRWPSQWICYSWLEGLLPTSEMHNSNPDWPFLK